MLEAERDITRRGVTVRTRNGLVANPNVRVARTYRAALQKYDSELGLSPVARERISPEAGDAMKFTDPIDEAFFGQNSTLQAV
jgi:P27 family predicted phage terminase small subunit